MDKGYDFLQENIKEEKMGPRKILLKIVRLMALGLVLGMAICVGFFAIKPWAEKLFPLNPEKVEISQEEEEEADSDVVEKIETPVEVQHDIVDYRELQNALSNVIKEADKKIVTITGIEHGDNWNTGEAQELTGVIVGDSGRELLILSNYAKAEDLQLFRAEFVDGSVHEAVIKQKDKTNNLAVFSVAKNDMSKDTLDKVLVATLSNTSVVSRGELLFIIGSPFGYSNGIATGIVSSSDEYMKRADGDFRMIVTDIIGNTKSDGIIFNSFGNVIGLVDTNLSKNGSSFPLMTIGISQIKDEIQLMSNGKNVPYIGIVGTMISEETALRENVPQGLFVQEVEVDSPAMAAGIKSGDIITEIDGEEIKTLSGYHKVMMKQQAGQAIRLSGQRSGLESYVEIKFNVTVGVK